MTESLYKNKDWLYNQYIILKKSLTQIGRECGVSKYPIGYWLKKHNIPVRDPKTARGLISRKGEKCPNWKGGITTYNGYKYIYMPTHPNANHYGYVAESRLIMEKHINKLLKPEEIVHHIDGNILNNNINNLYLCKNRGEHIKFHKIHKIKKVC